MPTDSAEEPAGLATDGGLVPAAADGDADEVERGSDVEGGPGGVAEAVEPGGTAGGVVAVGNGDAAGEPTDGTAANSGEGVAGDGDVVDSVVGSGEDGGAAVASHTVDGDVVGGDEGVGGATESVAGADLVPVLWSDSSALGMDDVPHWPVAGGRLHLGLAVVASTSIGEFGVFHVSYRQVGEFSFDVLMAEACAKLASGLRLDTRETPTGELFSITGTLVAAAVCLPEFYRLVSDTARAERLVVGIPCPDEVYAAPADSPVAAEVHRAVRESTYQAAELVPAVLSIHGDSIEVVAERE